jgi:hypothetical protein
LGLISAESSNSVTACIANKKLSKWFVNQSLADQKLLALLYGRDFTFY